MLEDKELKSGLQSIHRDIENAFNVRGTSLTPEIQKATKEAMALEKAMRRATTDKGISYYSLQSELRKAGTSAAQLTSTLAAGGDKFAASLNAANTALALSNRHVISLNAKVQEMARVMLQSFKFTAAQAAIQGISGQIQEAVRWTVDLYDAINEIGIVTGKSGAELEAVTQRTISAAKDLRVAAKEYAQGELIFYQQGLNDAEVARRTEIVTKAAKASGESMAQMSSEMTAIWNNYHMVGEEQARAASVGAKMAAQTAVDFSDIAEAMQTAAAPAAQMGVTYDSLAAIIATVGDTTQQSASVIGNAYKTIFSRFQQLKAEGTDGEVTLNRVSSQLRDLGINALDSAGNLRPLGDMIHEVGEQWDGWSSKQQLAIAQLVGGTRQYGQFLALMNNYDKYQENLQAAQTEDGSTLEAQYNQYLESIESYAENAGEAWNRAFSEIIDPEALKGVYKMVETIGNGVGAMLDGLGGAPGLLVTIGAILSSKIVPSIMKAGQSVKDFVQNLTPEGREKGINADFAAQEAAVKAAMSKTSDPNTKIDLSVQQQKLAVNREIAIVNERINTALQTASGAYKINLEYQQQQLALSQQEYQRDIDRLKVLEQQAIARQKRNEKTNDEERIGDKNKNLTQLGRELILERDRADQSHGEDKVKAIEEAHRLTSQLNNRVQDLDDSFSIVASQMQRGGKASVTAINSMKEAFERCGVSSKELGNKIETMIETGDIQEINGMIDKVHDLRNSFIGAKQEAEDFGAAVDAAEGAKRAKDRAEEIKGEVERGKEASGSPTKIDFAGISSGLVEMTMNAGLATTAMTNLFQVLSNDDLSFGEKIVALLPIVAQLVMSIQMLSSAFAKTKALVLAASVDSNALAAARTAEAAATKKAAAAEEYYNKVKNSGSSQNIVNKAKDLAGKRAEEAQKATKNRENIEAGNLWQGLKNIKAEGLSKAGQGFAKLGEIAGKAGTKVVGVMAKIGAGSAALGTAISVGVVAGVAALAYAMGELQKQTPEAKLERMSKASEQLKATAQAAQERAQKLKDTIESYDGAAKSLDKCTAGTQEFRDALSSANSEAMNVIEQLSQIDGFDLSSAYSRDENGLIVFDEAALQKAQDMANQTAAQIQLSSGIAQGMTSQMKTEVEARELGEAYDGVETVFGQGIQDFFDTFLGYDTFGDKIYDNLDTLVEAMKEGPEAFKEEILKLQPGIDLTEAEFAKLQTSVQNLAIQQDNAAEQMRITAQNFVEQTAKGKSNQDKKALSEYIARSSQKGGALYKSKTDWLDNTFHQNWDGSGADRQQIIDAYNKANGTNLKAADNFAIGSDNDREFQLEDAEGQIIKVSKEYVASLLAGKEAMDNFSENAKAVTDTINEIQKAENLGEDKKDQGLTDFLTTGSFGKTSEAQLSKYQDKETVTAQLESIFGDAEALEEKAKALGYDTADSMVDAIVEGAANAQERFDNVGKDMVKSVEREFDQIDNSDVFNEMGVDQQEQVANMYKKAFSNGGQEGLNLITEMITGSGKDLEEVMSLLGDVDWANITPEELAEKLDDTTLASTGLINKLPELISLMNKAAAVDLSAAQEHYKKLDGMKDLEFGDTIDPTQYEQLSPQLKSYFQEMADGTFMLIGKAQEFKAAVGEAQMDKFNQLMEQNQAKIDAINNAKDIDYNSIQGSAQTYDIGKWWNPADDTKVIDTTKAANQLDFLKASDFENLDQLADWENRLNDLSLNAQDYKDIAQAVADAKDQTGQWDEKLKEVEEQQEKIKESIQATRMRDDMEESNADMDDVEDQRDALEQMIEASDEAELAAKGYNKALLEDESALNEVAKEQARFNAGLKSGGEHLEDWKQAVGKDGVKDTQKFAESIDDMRTAYADLLDVDPSSLSEDFLANGENLEDFETILTGTAEEAEAAFARLQKNAIMDLDLNIDDADFNSALSTIQGQLADVEAGTEITPSLDNTAFFDALNQMIMACGSDLGKIEALFNNLNLEPITFDDLVQTTGVDVEAETKDLEATGFDQENSYDVVPGGSKPLAIEIADGSSDIDISSGTMGVIRVPTWNYVAKPVTTPKKKSTPATSYKLKEGTGVVKSSGGKQRVNNATPPSSGNYRGGGSKPKGGGGGGGGGKAAKHKAKKAAKYKPTQDRYGTIKAKMDKVERSLDHLSDATDKAFGAQAIRNMQKINKELQEQGHHYDELYKKAKQYHKIDLADMETERIRASEKLGIQLMKAETNDDGFVKNRTEIFEQINKRLKTAYDKYKSEADKFDKAKSTDENWSERIDDLKEEYETLKTAAEDYIGTVDQVDETANKMAEAIKDALDNLYTWMENKVEEANRKLELRVSINERDIEMVDFLLDKLGDTGLKQGKAWDGMKKNIKSTQNSLDGAVKSFERMQEILFNINDPNQQKWFENTFGSDIWKKYQASGGRLPQEVIDQMDDNADQMMDNLDTMFENADEMLHMYMEIFDLYLNEFDAIADKLSNNNDRLELFNELLEFSGQKYNPDAYGATKDLMDASISNAKTEVKRAKAVLDLSAQAAEETEKQLQSFYDDYGTDRDAWTTSQVFVHDRLLEARNEAQDALSDAQGDFTSAIKDLTDAASEAIEQMAEVIKMQVVDNLGGIFDSFDAMTEVYDQQYSLDHFFLEDYDKNYQLSDLLTQIEKQMEEVTDPARLEEFKALIDEINAANEEGVQITQTDVDLLKAKFEMQKAQDAYEEAQAAKNTMRLARDASGNWNYIYSTDAEDSSNAAEELANAQHNYEKLLHEARDEASELWMQAQQEFFEFQETIDWARYNQDEKYKQQIDYQYNYYMTTTERYTSQVAKYNDMLGDNFEDTSLGIITGFSSIEEAQKVYSEQHAAMNEQMNENTQEWGNVVKETCIEMGIDYEDLEDVIREETSQMIDENQALEDKIDDLKNRASEDLTEMNNKVSGWRASFVSDMDQAIAKVKELIDWLQNLKKVQLGQMTYDKNTDYYDYFASEYAASGLKGNKEEIKQWLKDNYEAEVYQRMGAYQDRFQGKEGYDHELATNPEKMLEVLADAIYDAVVLGNANFWENDSWNYGSGTSGLQSKYPKKGKAASGGLISSRGVYELAESAPELVLNPADTRNILNAVRAMRDIVNAQIATAQGAMLGGLPQMAGKSEPTTVQQDVKIEASFPGVSVASEIEEAFNNLINQVAQYRIKK